MSRPSPTLDGKPNSSPLEFLAQLNLAELAAIDPEQRLPNKGHLYFFFGSTEDFTDIGKVLFTQAKVSSFTRAEFPKTLPKDRRYKPVLIQPKVELTVPLPGELDLPDEEVDEHLELWDTLKEDCESLQGFGNGYPDLIQSPGFASNTRLLLQVDSDKATGMRFGDGGTVFYLLSKQNLKKQQFTKASALLEMS